MHKLNIHLTQTGVLIGRESPFNLITPQFIGQMYIQDNGYVHISHGLNSDDWTQLQSGYSLNVAVSTYEEMLRLPKKLGSTCFVEELSTYFKFIGDEWVVDKGYVLQKEEPVDKSVIWFTPESNGLKKPPNSSITIEELVATISVLVTKIRGLDKRITYLEENGYRPPSGGEDGDNSQESDILLLEDGTPLLLEDGSTIKLETI